MLLFIGTTAVVESTQGSDGLEGDILIGMKCSSAKRPKVIIGWSLAGLGIAGLLGATLWPRRADPLLAAWEETR